MKPFNIYTSSNRISFPCVYSPDHQNRGGTSPETFLGTGPRILSEAVPLSFYLPTRISCTIVRGLAEVHTAYVYHCPVDNCFDAVTGYQNAKNTTGRS